SARDVPAPCPRGAVGTGPANGPRPTAGARPQARHRPGPGRPAALRWRWKHRRGTVPLRAARPAARAGPGRGGRERIMTGRELTELETPTAVVDVDTMAANLARMADYARSHGLRLRPHIKTHKTPELAAEQLRHGADGVTVATLREAEVMAAVAEDILIAYPPVGRARIERLLALPPHLRLSVALDSHDALRALAAAAAAAGREIGVLVELDLGMGRCGVPTPEAAVALAKEAATLDGVAYRGVLFYPGHIREPVAEQGPALARLQADLDRFRTALARAGVEPEVVSGGST